MNDNGKDPDGFENVEGNVTAKSTLLGLRVRDASTKEGRNGDAIETLTIVGQAKISAKMVGQSCEIQTAGGSRRMVAHVHELKITEGKKGGPNITTLKVNGSPDLHKLGLVQVNVVQRQGELPGIDPDGDEDEAPPSPPKKRRARATAGSVS